MQLGFNHPNYTIEINGVKYEEMDEAPARVRAALARSTMTMKMDGPKKIAKFGLMRKGEYIGVSTILNTLTKFAKLQVGKHVVTARQRQSGDQLYPLAIAIRGLHPLTKVWVTYEPLPKNNFIFRINDEDFYSLVKEEVDFDPSQT